MPEATGTPDPSCRAVLLDIDGTLIDSNDAHARAWVASLAAHGYVVAFERVRPLVGKGGDKILPELVGLDPESGEAKRIGQTRGELFRARELAHLAPTRGARALLTRLRTDGYELVVATSAQEADVAATLEQAGVSDLIQASASSMLGDTPYDIEAAARARVDIVVLRCGGYWSDADLVGARAIYDDPADIVAHYDDSPFAAR
jgi:phosphoglycolate phosphatase-like HAD superfamily hydrolase